MGSVVRLFAGALCLIAIGLASGAVGLFAYAVLTELGFVPSAEIGLLSATVAGTAYAAVQLAFLSFLRFCYPTRDAVPYLLDALSQAPALLLLPLALGQEMALPHPLLERFAPLVFLAAFVLLHGGLKFLSFFAFISGRTAPRWPSIAYAAATVVLGFVAMTSASNWLDQFEEMRPGVPDAAMVHRAGFTTADARAIPEGVPLEIPIALEANQVLDLRWSVNPDELPVERVWVTIRLYGSELRRIARHIPVDSDGWTTMRVGLEDIPDGLERMSIVWGIDPEPPWMRFVEFRPIPSAGRSLQLSGPFIHSARTPALPPNVIIIAVDGLGGNHVSHLGYNRETTAQLDGFALRNMRMERAYTPAPDAAAAAWSLLTGIHPANHGMYGATVPATVDASASLVEKFRARGFATAAFTEASGDRLNVLGEGTPFAHGYELFDTAYITEGGADADTQGSRATLVKLRSFVELHAGVGFFAFVRLRELADLQYRVRYGGAFVDEPDTAEPVDVLDSAIAYLDEAIGNFAQEIVAGPLRRNTIIVVCGLYGFDFAQDGRPMVGVREASLHVPLLLYVPGQGRVMQREPISLEDIAPTLLQLTGLPVDSTVDGLPFLPEPHERPAMSVQRNPLAYSLRTARWRYSWMPAQEDREEWMALYDMGRTPPQERARFNPAIVAAFKPRLETLHAQLQSLSAR